MSHPAIRVEGLSKKYRLGSSYYGTLVAEWQSFWARVHKREDPNSVINASILMDENVEAKKPNNRWIQALHDVSFEVSAGRVMGLIGNNGAGKSTMLKILSRITAPTTGRAWLRGKVSSLLEVGTGFHPDLTGRENVFLNGAILGMKRAEIAAKFDEIVAFAEVERFIDTPVKRYSSGMHMRLAFSVAAHLEPEIMIIDEVLAVGDGAFQQKCLGKLGDVARSGRTILFVSHNLAAVEALCQDAVVLERGSITFQGDPKEAVTHYLRRTRTAQIQLEKATERLGSQEVRIVAVELRDQSGHLLPALKTGQNFEVHLYFEKKTSKPFPRFQACVFIKNHVGLPLFNHYNALNASEFGVLPDQGKLVCSIDRLPLPGGAYQLGFALGSQFPNGDILDIMDNALQFSVEGGSFFTGAEHPSAERGVFLIDAHWRLENTVRT